MLPIRHIILLFVMRSYSIIQRESDSSVLSFGDILTKLEFFVIETFTTVFSSAQLITKLKDISGDSIYMVVKRYLLRYKPVSSNTIYSNPNLCGFTRFTWVILYAINEQAKNCVTCLLTCFFNTSYVITYKQAQIA